MKSYDEQLASAVAAVHIHSPTGYWWFGKQSARVPRKLQRALTPETARNFLLFTLQLRLYNDFYCKGAAAPSGRDALELPATGMSPFVQQLSAANGGVGYWGDGWEVEEVSDAEVLVHRDGLRLRARSEECKPAASATNRHARSTSRGEVAISCGERIYLRYPKELRGMSPGFYMALGNEEMMDERSEEAVRLYWNLSPDGAVGFLRRATSGLNEAAIPFKIKVLNDPRKFTRCDTVVVYIRKADYRRVDEPLLDAHAEVRDALKPGTPGLTKPLHSSVGLAEDPGGGESFGLHRCGIVAEGLIRAYERGLSDDASRLRTVVECFDEIGIRPDLPFLNPGSHDEYGDSELAAHLQRSVARPSRATRSTARATLSAVGDTDFLETAVAIGRRLQQQAIWHRGRCTWLGSKPRGHGKMVADGPVYETLGPDLYAGTSGVALFLAELCAATGDRDAGKVALGAMRHAFAKRDDVAPTNRVALYAGWMGIALAGARIATILQEDELHAAACGLLKRALMVERLRSEPDLLSGRAGAVLALVAIQTGANGGATAMLGRPGSTAARAVCIADELLDDAIEEERGCSWRSAALHDQCGLTGYSHGAAGVGHALLELFDATGDGRYRTGAERAFAYERSWFHDDVGNWPDFRDQPKRRAPGGRRSQRTVSGPLRFSATWCNGAPGIALSRIRAREVLGDDPYGAEATVALRTTGDAVEAWLADGTTNFSLCHGLAGNADVLLHGARRFGGGPRAEALAGEVGRYGISRYARRGQRWPCGTGEGETPSLMLGLAGIGHFYLRLHSSATPSVLLLGPEFLSTPVSAHLDPSLA